MNMSLVCAFPAFHLEAIGFDPNQQPSNRLVREVAARVIAIAAPFFYVYQIAWSSVVLAVDFPLALCRISSGILAYYGYWTALVSIHNFFSSLLEIPEKVIFGPHRQPNYFGDEQRYNRGNFLKQPLLLP